MFFEEEFRHLKIQIKDIILATDNFSSNNQIGQGGFGLVYKGELSLPEGRSTVAVKRLDRRFGQGNAEFWKEIMMLSRCKHENLVSLVHFCFQKDEMILVYEYASRGSLDHHLSDPSLSWIQRLKICLGAARGISYLHDPMETKQRVLHRDIKSANILLDEKWNAKVSDFGLSKVGPANQPQTYLVSNVVGTFGYCDPAYFETGLLSKESDVYSFGVVLFEVMCGRLCCEYRNGKLTQVLVPMWKKCFDEKRLDDVIFHELKGQVGLGSLTTFSTIANQCLNRDHKERPTMVEIVKELELALKQQFSEDAFKEGMSGGGGGHDSDSFDKFQSFFGGNPFGGGSDDDSSSNSNRRRRRRGEDVICPIRVSLEDLCNGTSKKYTVSRDVICSECKGKGSKPFASIRCSSCQGYGMNHAHTCEECKGTSINDNNHCPQCKGTKVVQETKILVVDVQKGMQIGENIIFRGESDEAPDTITGDIIFVLKQK